MLATKDRPVLMDIGQRTDNFDWIIWCWIKMDQNGRLAAPKAFENELEGTASTSCAYSLLPRTLSIGVRRRLILFQNWIEI
jgi:hypothetical protein